MPSIIANNLRSGNVIDHKSQPYRVVSVYHVKPGKGGAFIQASLKNIKNGNKLDCRFRSDESVEKMHNQSVPAIILFSSKDSIEVTRSDNFEQVTIDKSIIGDKIDFLEDGMDIMLNILEDIVYDVQLKETVKLKVVSTEPKMKNQTVTASTKPAVLSNGITVIVPQFIEENDEIIIRTEDSTYVERA